MAKPLLSYATRDHGCFRAQTGQAGSDFRFPAVCFSFTSDCELRLLWPEPAVVTHLEHSSRSVPEQGSVVVVNQREDLLGHIYAAHDVAPKGYHLARETTRECGGNENPAL